ncbi:monocarboxylate transporter 12-like isoform X1 [Asterias rubens]|uniref:monocarboxylate transporter 12-like isoform X1 n=2 Tax=Asterias rubens TaxID=7604 RepID=UPI0014550A43|nr:monocarboxylate transporter 12-like isoform X1 [Asterias rubens]
MSDQLDQYPFFQPGPAVGVTSVVTREMIGHHFRESLTMALGLGGLGSSLAFVTMVPLTQFFLDTYGWRGTMLLLGAIFSHLGVCGALMKEPAVTRSYDEYQTVDVIEEPAVTGEGEADASNSRCHSCLETVHSFFSKTFNISLLSSTSFWLINFMMNIWMIMYTAWFIYFVPNTISKGLSLKEASTCVVIYGIGRLPASVTIGPLVRYIPGINNSGWLGIGLVTQCIYYLLDPWLITYWPIFWAAFIFGYFSAVLLLLFDVIIIDIFGADQLGSVLGLIGPSAGLSRIFSLYFPGLIYDILGSYTLAFTVMGGVQCLTVVALLLLVWLQRRHPSGL